MKAMMSILALDTSTDYLTLAVTRGGRTAARLHRKAPRSHSTLLMSAIDTVLRKARLKLADLDGIAVGVGPGSFTGLRIGVATVKGLAYVTGVPVAAVPTFDAIARNAGKAAGTVCVVLDARKGKVYGAFYEPDGRGGMKRLSPYLLVPLEELLKIGKKYGNLYFIGDYAARIPGAAVAAADWHPRAGAIAALGLEALAKKKTVSPEKLEPMYIYSRECDITGR